MTKKLVVGSRGSKLALWQANFVADQIKQHYPAIEVSIKPIMTTGDRILDVPLAKIGGKGLFTKELEKELLAGQIDLAVHSLKDMPTQLPEGLSLGAITERFDAGDALISPQYGSLAKLPQGARVGTSSLRRKAQLLHCRPDLQVTDLRGNLDTRLEKLQSQELDAIVLAVAGLKRLGWEKYISQILPYDICLPAVGQGALTIEIRDQDLMVQEVLQFLHHTDTAQAVTAERAYLNELEGDCQVPFGVYGCVTAGVLRLEAAILTVDGQRKLGDEISGSPADAESLGRGLARRMFAAGGREILLELKLQGYREGEKC